ncbi:peptidoglycan-binding domain-containing protein [Shinella sp. S4-D37]|uniref:peptidoglycan-binding domain-containing protein n=1 Tax=Shinella sp. S4-D37 TaxID=3161999 RepID=UPI003465366B
MSIRLRATLLSCAAAIAFAGTPVAGQDLGGIINLMGRVIEHDMQNQAERRRQQAQERLYREQQRAIAREEQARIDEVRRQEIILIKRLQTALSKLGFYESKIDGDRGPGTRKAEALFSAAFNVDAINLDEETIAALEDIAALGFRSGEEHRQATAAGFTNRTDYLAAMKGGFETAQDYESAKRQGFDTFEDFRLFRTSGFTNSADYRIAKQGGFSDSAEFEAATKLGFSERKDYLDFKSTGLADKKSYEAAKVEKQAIQKAADTCDQLANGDDLVRAVDVCLAAVSLGVTAPLKPSLERLNDRINESLKIEQAAAMPDVQVASQGAGGQNLPAAGDFLARRAALRSAQQRLACGSAVVNGSWSDADEQCGLALQSDATEEIRQLKTKAGEELAAAQAEAEKAERELKAAADAEQKRLALDAARNRMTALMSAMTEFSASKGTFSNAIGIAKAAVRLKQLEGSEDVSSIEQAILSADELLKSEAGFQKFLADKERAGEIAQVNARATALAEIRRTEAFITQFVGSNVLHESVNDLLTLQDKLSAAKGSEQDERLFHAQKEAKAEIERIGLSDDLASFIFEENVPKDTGIAQAENGLAITEDNRALLEGNANDVVILGNFTSGAPHLLVNLLGETTLDGGNAVYCWIGRDTSNPPLFDLVSPVLRKLGASRMAPSGACVNQSALQQDILIVERGALLARDILEARYLIEALEKGDLKVIQTIAWGEVGAVAEQRKQLSDTIRSEVVGGVRSGFGFVQVENTADTLCMVVDPAEQSFHDYAFEIVGPELELVIPVAKERTALSLDRAFAGAQKNMCRVIYANAENMARLIEATKKLNAEATVLPLWIETKLIEDGKNLAEKSAQERQAEIAARRQEMEAAATLAKKQSEEAAVVRARAQQELRDRYSQEARSAYNELSGIQKAFISNDSTKAGQFASLFPDIARWKQEIAAGGWELDKYDDELVDYGTANWMGRKLEAVTLKATISTKNAVRGEYATICFVTGYLMDTEFEMRRDAMAVECGASDKVLADWQTSRTFESRWVAR